MQWIKIVGVGLVAAILIGAAAAENKPAARRHVDGVEGFSLSPPASVQAVTKQTKVAEFQVGVDDGFVSNINVIVDPGKTTLKEYMDKSLQELTETHPQEVMNSRNKLEVSGKEAELLDFSANAGGRRLRFLQLIVVDTDRVYIVTCTSPAENGFLLHQKEFQACIDSFRLEK